IGRFAGDQRRLPAGAFRLGVVRFRGGPFLQGGVNFDIAEANPDAGDGRVAGQRKAVSRLEDVLAGVPVEYEGLRGYEGRQGTGDFARESSWPEGQEPPRFAAFGFAFARDFENTEPVRT